jgi:alkylation response protein AidB-like acyl-CoA dehydrogenase
MYATMAVNFDDPKARTDAIAAAKVQVGRSAKYIGQQSIQLHGGVGMTMEYKIGHYFKRMTMIESTLGDSDFHLRRLAAQGGLFR